ncbi:MAG: glycine cleavage system aminomethyltransferase GcvT [Alphaproteobacteria bacterium]|nr:glycine cleavage system aminomethyltransferase GcvT [Alphaproteobacteria bacterium]
MSDTDTLKKTPLFDLHQELGGELVEFAGYAMPVRYPAGIMAEHKSCRTAAALFDVSHMGQVRLSGKHIAEDIEALVPGDIQALKPGRMRYTLLTNDMGGVRDDLIITNAGDHLFAVLNAACKAQDIAHLQDALGSRKVEALEDQALLALQGPKAVGVIAALDGRIDDQRFMSAQTLKLDGISCFVSRSGYTGEDGVEISVAAKDAEKLARLLLSFDDVSPAGLGARDSLRLEAGLCLYGADLDEATTPVEAQLAWTISKRRRTEGGFPGEDIILDQLENGAKRYRVGIRPVGRAPARAHTAVLDESDDKIGEITSGGFGPTVGGPVAMGYVNRDFSETGTRVGLDIRGKRHDAEIAALPFVRKGWK